MDVEDLRKQIDELDRRIVKLLAERTAVARDIGKKKMQVDTDRRQYPRAGSAGKDQRNGSSRKPGP